jgi:hypothetical protein
MSISSMEMPCWGLAALGSVRTSMKIQSAYCPSVVQVFCPLTTYSSPSRTAVVRSEARSEPASGSENPWHHQMSRAAVGGRNRALSLFAAEGRDDRADHVGVERQRRRHARQLHLVEPDVALQVGPVLAAPFQRPARHREPGLVLQAVTRGDVVLCEFGAGARLVADLLRDGGREELARLLPERAIVLAQSPLHPWPPRPRPANPVTSAHLTRWAAPRLEGVG